MAYENIQVSREGPIATLTVNRPKALNALNSATLRELLQAVREAAESSRALILTGAGDKAFVAGADISEMAPMTPWTAREFSELGHLLTAMLEDIPCATIAAVNGYALGGGLELAVACDMIYASENAKVGFPEVTLGITPGFGGTQRLVRLVGKLRAKEIIFTGVDGALPEGGGEDRHPRAARRRPREAPGGARLRHPAPGGEPPGGGDLRAALRHPGPRRGDARVPGKEARQVRGKVK